MTRKGLWIAAVVVLASNAFTLWAARANRAGEPEAVLELTERELRLPSREADNTAMALRLEWTDLQPRYPAEPVPGWFDRAKLASLGFDTSLPVANENAEHYRGMAPRAVYAVLEYDGEAWRAHFDSLAEPADKEAAGRRTRLALIDVGLDAAALRARHPDRTRTAVVPATAGLSFVQPRSGQPFLRGRINVVFPVELNVPRELRPVLESLSPRATSVIDRQSGEIEPAGEPRYRVTVRWGRSLEPWIAGVELIK